MPKRSPLLLTFWKQISGAALASGRGEDGEKRRRKNKWRRHEKNKAQCLDDKVARDGVTHQFQRWPDTGRRSADTSRYSRRPAASCRAARSGAPHNKRRTRAVRLVAQQ